MLERLLRTLLLLICLLLPFPAFAAESMLIKVPTRPGVTVPVYLMKQSNATATLALLPGGNGGIGLKDEVPSSRDFLVQNRENFARQGFNVAVVGKPNDIGDLDLATRRGSNHLTDLRRIIEYLREATSLPVWLVGMSRGTVSATAAAAAYGSEDLAGIVLVSSITSTVLPYSVPRQRLDRIQIPVLVLHHEKDTCAIADPDGVAQVLSGLTSAPVAKAVLVNGGWGARGDPCTSSNWHGFSGMEREAVNLIARWIRQPEP
jgi:pimeloyl-ACP methyl ester carboxylesterase